MSLGLLVGFLIIFALFSWVLRPLFAVRQSRQRSDMERAERGLEDLLFEREAALAAIRDLQLDHAMGKLSDADYTELDTRYRAQAIDLMQQLDTLDLAPVTHDADTALDAWIERAVAAARGGGTHVSHTAMNKRSDNEAAQFSEGVSTP